jgi:putative toxin-antitoxin system antitoxin component (TIGR02293 family)
MPESATITNEGSRRSFRQFQPAGAGKQNVWQRLRLPASHGPQLIGAIEEGFDLRILEALRAEIELPHEEVLHLAGISPRTYQRRRSEGKPLRPEESDRVSRLVRVIDATEQLFESDREAAREWLNRPARGLGGKTPISLLHTETGARDVLQLIGRLEHGVF